MSFPERGGKPEPARERDRAPTVMDPSADRLTGTLDLELDPVGALVTGGSHAPTPRSAIKRAKQVTTLKTST
jgi:hypothetical protein